jgi:hypothetical protein
MSEEQKESIQQEILRKRQQTRQIHTEGVGDGRPRTTELSDTDPLLAALFRAHPEKLVEMLNKEDPEPKS